MQSKVEMSDNNPLKMISDREMDRREFLKYGGLVLLSLVGLKGVVNLLARVNTTPDSNVKSGAQATRGFGSGKYGV